MNAMIDKWPDNTLECQMIRDADAGIGTSEAADDTACAVRALLSRVRELEAECARFRAKLSEDAREAILLELEAHVEELSPGILAKQDRSAKLTVENARLRDALKSIRRTANDGIGGDRTREGALAKISVDARAALEMPEEEDAR